MAAPQNQYWFDISVVKSASENWRRCEQGRVNKCLAIENGAYDWADSRERLAKWANRRLDQVRSLPIQVTLSNELLALRSAPPVQPKDITNTFVERVIGATRDFLAIAFLDRATTAARSVGRIETRLSGGRRGYGTGFLVSPRLLLTNNHVLGSPDDAAASIVEFDYQLDSLDQPLTIHRFALDPDAFFLTDTKLDFALVAVKPVSGQGRPLSHYGWCPLIGEEGKIRIGDCVNIVQHPRGEMKQVVIRENKLLDLPEGTDVAHYEGDTEPGSSGSPIFSDRWEVVALHHSGVPRMDKRGRFLDVNGKVWKSGGNPATLAWQANEGIRVSRLLRHIESAQLPPEQDALRRALLSGREPPPPTRGSNEDARGGTDVEEPPPVYPSGSPTGAVSITMPLTITVSLSGAPGPGTPPTIDASSIVSVGAPVEALEAIQPDPNYDHRPGYDPMFLGFEVPLPALRPAIRPKAERLTNATGPNDYVLKYHHYSAIMNGERRLAFVSAVNYAPIAPVHYRRTVADKWFFDPRVDDDAQAGEEFYANPLVDRGHLVARRDAAWGQTEEEAKRANDDTFHWTNCSPQHEVFNQSGLATSKGLHLWGNIENHIAAQGRERLSIFNGPVFRTADKRHRGLKVPRQFWKVVVFKDDAGDPEALAFVLSQQELIKDLPVEEFVVGPFAPFQVKLRKIETLTKLNFGALKTHDPLEDSLNERFFEAQTGAIPLTSLDDIVT
jgi:endonuclease G